MDISKVLSWITPLVGVAVMGIIMILYGFVDMKQQNNALQFLFGIPIAAGAFGLHLLIRRFSQYNTLHIWIAETIIVGFMWYVFQRS